MKRAVAVIILVLVSAGCGGSSTSPSPGPSPSEPAVLVGAGDIGDCATRGSGLTAQLLDRTSGTVFTAGDNAYPSGTAANYRDCYDPTWGRHRGRTRPSPGNHEYEASGGGPYFQYFGDRAGPPGLGYYSYTLGAWHVLSLNSEVGFDGGSGQMAWLRAELASNQSQCEVAYFHKPLFSSGEHGDQRQMLDMWRTLYEFGVDIVVSGHDHNYERFAPLAASVSSLSARAGQRCARLERNVRTVRCTACPGVCWCSHCRPGAIAGSSCRLKLAGFRMVVLVNVINHVRTCGARA